MPSRQDINYWKNAIEIKTNGVNLAMNETVESRLANGLPTIPMESLDTLNPQQKKLFLGLLDAARESMGEDGDLVYDDQAMYPADYNVLMKYPGVDPLGKYSELDMQMYARLDRLRARSAFLPERERTATERMLGGEELQDMLGHLRNRSMQVRRLDRMLQLAECSTMKHIIVPFIQQMRNNLMDPQQFPPNLKKFEDAVSGLEFISGIRSDLQGADEARKNVIIDAIFDLSGSTLQEIKPAKLELRPQNMSKEISVPLNDMRESLYSVKFTRMENWGRPAEQWKTPDEGFSDTYMGGDLLTRWYAEGAAQKAIDQVLPRDILETEDSPLLNPLDMVVVAGVPAREMAEEALRNQAIAKARQRYNLPQNQQPSREVTDTIYMEMMNDPKVCRQAAKWCIGVGMMYGAPVTVLRPTGSLGLYDGAAFEVRNDAKGYVPKNAEPTNRPVLTLWERFANFVFGAYKDKVAQLQNYDAGLEHRRQHNEKIAAQVRSFNARSDLWKQGSVNQSRFDRYSNNRAILFGTYKDEYANSKTNVSKLRRQCAAANQPFDLAANRITDRQYTNMVIAFINHPKLEAMCHPQGEKDPNMGSLLVTCVDDAGKDRDGTDKKFSIDAVNKAHTLARDLLTAEKGSPKYQEASEYWKEVLPRLIRSGLRGGEGISETHYTYLEILDSFDKLSTARPELLEGMPEDVLQGIKAGVQMKQAVDKAAQAMTRLATLPAPTPEESENLVLDVLTKRYLSTLVHMGQTDVKSSQEFQLADRQLQEVILQGDDTEEALQQRHVLFAKLTSLGVTLTCTLPLSEQVQALSDPGVLQGIRDMLRESPAMNDLRQQAQANGTTLAQEAQKAFALAEDGHYCQQFKETNYDQMYQPTEIKNNLANAHQVRHGM